MSRLRQFAAYTRKVFHLDRLAARITDPRPNPVIPAQRVWWDLWVGAVCKVPRFFQLQTETQRRPWRRTLGASRPISHDTLGYVTARMPLEPLRAALVTTHKLLQRNKAFQRNQISGLLALNVDANEQFKSRSRCCPQCRQRQVKVKKADGQEEAVKNCACNSIGPSNRDSCCPGSAGDLVPRLEAVCSLTMENSAADCCRRSVYAWPGRNGSRANHWTVRPFFRSAASRNR